MGVGAATAIVGAVGSIGSNRKLKKLLAKAPKYKINEEVFENQNLARSQAFGRDTAIKTQQENIEQEAANAGSEARQVSTNTSDLLSTIAAINAQKNESLRGLAQQESATKNDRMQQLYNVNMATGEEKDKAWNYNVNMPYQQKVAALRDKKKFNQELIMKGIDAQAAQDTQAMQTVGSMFSSGAGAMFSDVRLKDEIKDTQYGIDDVKKMRVVDFEYNFEEGQHTGVIAQEMREVVPHAVIDTDITGDGGEKLLKVNYNEIVPVLIKAVQDQQKMIDSLKKRISEFEYELTAK